MSFLTEIKINFKKTQPNPNKKNPNKPTHLVLDVYLILPGINTKTDLEFCLILDSSGP